MRTSIEEQVSEFRRRCREAGLSLTVQREMIYRVVLESKAHPSPEWIFEKVKAQAPAISLATVYKNIHAFLEAGLLREVTPNHGPVRLEANLSEHHHLVCVQCRTIIDLDEADVEPVSLLRRPPAGFRLMRSSVEFQGLCGACAKSH